MLSLFKGKTKPVPVAKRSRSKSIMPHPKVVPEVNQVVTQEVLSSASRETYQFKTPEQELGMSDLIRDHKPGTRFKYIAITGKDAEKEEALLRKIFALRPKVNMTTLPLETLPELELTDDESKFTLDKVLGPKKGLKYVRIAEAAGIFSPLSSVMSVFTKIQICLMDGRTNPPQCIQKIVGNTNMALKFRLSMEFYVPRSEAHHISVEVVREVPLTENTQWGAIQIRLGLQEADFPMQHPIQKVVAAIAPTSTAMEDFEVDPNSIDVTILGNDLKKIRNMYQEGEIADEDDPIQERTARITYAQSSIRALPKGKQVENEAFKSSGWGFMNESRIANVPADQVSDEPEDEGSDGSGEEARQISAAEWEKEQEKLRAEMDVLSETTVEIPESDLHRRNISGSTIASSLPPGLTYIPPSQGLKPAIKKQAHFGPTSI